MFSPQGVELIERIVRCGPVGNVSLGVAFGVSKTYTKLSGSFSLSAYRLGCSS